MMAGKSIEETVTIVYPTGYESVNQFLGTFISKVFPYMSGIVQIKECTTTGLCYMRCFIYVRVEPGVQIFCRVLENYIKVVNPNGHNAIQNL